MDSKGFKPSDFGEPGCLRDKLGTGLVTVIMMHFLVSQWDHEVYVPCVQLQMFHL